MSTTTQQQRRASARLSSGAALAKKSAAEVKQPERHPVKQPESKKQDKVPLVAASPQPKIRLTLNLPQQPREKKSEEKRSNEEKRKSEDTKKEATKASSERARQRTGLLSPQTSHSSLSEKQPANAAVELPSIFAAPTAPLKRRVGRPTKAESLARLAAREGLPLDVVIAKDEAERAAAKARKKLEAPPRRARRPLLDESMTAEEALLLLPAKRRRGRPSKEELRLRALQASRASFEDAAVADGDEKCGLVSLALLRSIASQKQALQAVLDPSLAALRPDEARAVVSAWDAEVALLNSRRVHHADSSEAWAEHFLPLWTVFCEPEPATVNMAKDDGVEERLLASLAKFEALARKIEGGVGELAVLDQRLCLEEERFLLGKLQKSLIASK